MTDRRTFIARFAKGTAGFALLGTVLGACGDDTPAGTTGAPGTTPTSAPTTAAPATSAPPTTQDAPATTAGSEVGAVDWERVLLGNVSAYVLVRGGEAAVVDTGNPGSAEQIAAGLSTLEVGWSDVGHVIITHLHPDHIGSLGDVMAEAPDATGYAGAADIPAISSPRPLTAVGDGDVVFDLTIIDTPGHTPGSISVHDPIGGLLLAGDALNGADGGVIGPNPRFTTDMDLAMASVAKLAGFEFDTVVFGHGDPVTGDASAQVAALVTG